MWLGNKKLLIFCRIYFFLMPTMIIVYVIYLGRYNPSLVFKKIQTHWSIILAINFTMIKVMSISKAYLLEYILNDIDISSRDSSNARIYTRYRKIDI